MMELARAAKYAGQIVDWLRPFCERIQVAGSIRRGCLQVNDIDLVCIPKVEVQKDLMGEEIGWRNFSAEYLQAYVAERNPMGSKTERLPYFVSGGEALAGGHHGKQLIMWLPKASVQLDLWFAERENFATRWMCRTGSKEHNIWLCERAILRGLKWDPYEGLQNGKKDIFPAEREADIYAYLGLKFIEPAQREAEWIRKNLDWEL